MNAQTMKCQACRCVSSFSISGRFVYKLLLFLQLFPILLFLKKLIVIKNRSGNCAYCSTCFFVLVRSHVQHTCTCRNSVYNVVLVVIVQLGNRMSSLNNAFFSVTMHVCVTLRTSKKTWSIIGFASSRSTLLISFFHIGFKFAFLPAFLLIFER